MQLQKFKQRLVGIAYTVRSKFFKSTNIKVSNDLIIKLETKNSHEIHRARTFYSKEPEMIEWLKQLAQINKGDNFVFYDIGANIGVYSLYTATLHKNSTVYSFEPESTNFSSLCSNISNNNLDNMIPFQIALSDEDGFELLHVGIVKAGAGAAAVGHDYTHIDKSTSFKQGIYCTSLDTIYDNDFFKKPNFIKIDVDGHETKIISKSKKILSDPILKGLIIEFEYSTNDEQRLFIEEICSYGFNLKLMSDWIDVNYTGTTYIRNFLFQR